jgi:hypothetical protein
MRILIALTRYAETGEGDIKALEGKFTGVHRLRVGDWRVRFRRVPAGAIQSWRLRIAVRLPEGTS